MVRWCLFLAAALAVHAGEIEYMSTQSSDEVSGFCEVAGQPDALTTAKGSFTEVCDDCDISGASSPPISRVAPTLIALRVPCCSV